MAGIVAGAVVSALGGAAAVGSLGVALITAASGLLVSTALQRVLAKKPEKQKRPGIQTQFTGQGDVTPQTIILGRYATAGHMMCPFYTHQGASSDDYDLDKITTAVGLGAVPEEGVDTGFGEVGQGDYATFVINIADMPVTELIAVYVDGVRFGLTEQLTGPVHPAYGQGVTTGIDREEWEDRLWIKFYDGTQNAADPYLLAAYGRHPKRPWKATSIHTGSAYAIITIKRDDSLFRGVPRFRFDVLGSAIPDPRGMSSGPSGNPIVQIHNLVKGIQLPDGQVYGLGATDMPDEWWHTAMDVADEFVDDGDGGTERQYRSGLEIALATPDSGGLDPLSAIDELLPAASASFADMGGRLVVRAGGPSTSVLSITDDDILNSREQSYNPFESLAQTHNAVAATYPSPKAKWEAVEAPLRKDDDAIAADGEMLIAGLTLNAVPYGTQVQRLQSAWVKDAGRRRMHVIMLPPRLDRVTVFDTITLTSQVHNYQNKLFEILEYTPDLETGAFQIVIREVDPADYTPSVSDLVAQPIPDVTRTPANGLLLQGVNAFPHVVSDSVAAIRMIWSLPSDTILGVAWTIRKLDTDEVVLEGSTLNPQSGVAIVSEGILPATTYTVELRPIADGQKTLPSPLITVTTFNVGVGSDDFWAELAQRAQDARDRLSTAMQNAFDRTEEGVISAMITDFLETARVDSVIEEQKSEIDGVSATLTQEYLTAVETNGALAQLETTLTASINSVSSNVTTLTSALATTDQALAQLAIDVDATFDTNNATIAATYLAQADLDSATADLVTQSGTTLNGLRTDVNVVQSSVNGIEGVYGVEVNNNGVVSGFGLISQLVDGVPVSDMIVDVNNFYVGTSDLAGNFSAPFVVTGGEVFLTKARIRNADIDTLKLAGNAATAADFGQVSNNTPGAGINTQLSGASAAVTIPANTTARVFISANYRQGYTAQPRQWGYFLFGGVNGTSTITTRTGMSATNDQAVVTHLVTATNTASVPRSFIAFADWFGEDGNIVLQSCTISIFAQWR